jgi:alpha-L-fucosidase
VNIGPRADGTIPEEQLQLLRIMGDWLKINGPAIYGTRYWKVNHQETGKLAFTTKDKTLFAIALEKTDAAITIEATKGWKEKEVKSVALLGSTAKIDWSMSPEGLVIRPPADFGESQFAWSFEINTNSIQHASNAIQSDVDKVFEGTKKVNLDGSH